jgi:hypothetical protein
LAFVDFDGDKAYHAYKLNQVIDSVFVKKNAENMYHGLKKLEAFLLEI